MTEFTAPNIVLLDNKYCTGCPYLRRITGGCASLTTRLNISETGEFLREPNCPLQPAKRCDKCMSAGKYDHSELHCTRKPRIGLVSADWYCADFKAKEK